ncbi:hypothetical protein T492DRAFT_1067620 [Pavlovales sp. CCMP2436]|nr:hypothetical protein T492DRAFT_1067620 [Pavlovales sp. CCMP2436]
MHPAFISDRLVAMLPSRLNFKGLPSLELVVDSVADGTVAVGVEWHVECGGQPIPLGRGLSHAIICPRTGKISRVVDIAEAPWRTVGIALAPAVKLASNLAKFVGMIRADRQSTAIAFASIWLLLSTLAVGWFATNVQMDTDADTIFTFHVPRVAGRDIGRAAPVLGSGGERGASPLQSLESSLASSLDVDGVVDRDYSLATRRRAYLLWDFDPVRMR